MSDVNLFVTTCRIAVGATVRYDRLIECGAVAYWFMLKPSMAARHIAGLDGVDDVSTLAGVDTMQVKRQLGDEVDWRQGTDGNVMTVRGRVPDHQALADAVTCIRDRVVIAYGE